MGNSHQLRAWLPPLLHLKKSTILDTAVHKTQSGVCSTNQRSKLRSGKSDGNESKTYVSTRSNARCSGRRADANKPRRHPLEVQRGTLLVRPWPAQCHVTVMSRSSVARTFPQLWSTGWFRNSTFMPLGNWASSSYLNSQYPISLPPIRRLSFTYTHSL